MKFIWLFLVLAIALHVAWALAHEAGAPPGHAGALGQPTCAAPGCHDSYPVNSGPGALRVGPVGMPDLRTTVIEVRFEGAPGSRWGVQATQRAPYQAYHMQPAWMDSIRVQLQAQGDTAYFSHTQTGVNVAPLDSVPRWRFAYTVGDSSLIADIPCPWVFAAGVAADGDGTPAGDYVYTNQEPFYGGLCLCRWYSPGDLNFDWQIRSGDIILLVAVVFKGAPLPEPCDIADPDCSGAITSTDIIYLVNTVFKGGYWPCGGDTYSKLLFSDLYCQ